MYRVVLVATLALLLAACSDAGSNNISAVTPLPTNTAISAATSTITEAEPMAPITATEVVPTATLAPTEASASERATQEINLLGNSGANEGTYPTPVIQTAGLDPGVARSIAMATDTAYEPEVANRISFESEPVSILFDEFYSGFNMRTGLVLSDKLLSLDGKRVTMEGYVAPPLKPRLDFFVLARVQLAFCPFCSSDAEWPDDIALVYLPDPVIISSEFPVRVTGTMEIGSSVDAETGMVSLVRIYADTWETLN